MFCEIVIVLEFCTKEGLLGFSARFFWYRVALMLFFHTAATKSATKLLDQVTTV